MLLVIPSLHISQGVCCDCIQGEQGTEQFYQKLSKDTIALIKLLRLENSKSIYIVDCDSFEGKNNQLNIVSISYVPQTVDIPIQVFSKFKNREECEMLLKQGVQRIVIDKSVINRISNIESLVQQYSSTRIVFHINQKELKGDNGFSLKDYLQYIKGLGANRLVFTFSNNKNNEQQLKELNDLALESNIKISIKNGVANSTQLLNLAKNEYEAIDSLIIGKELFINKFPCQKMWRMVEQKVDALEK